MKYLKIQIVVFQILLIFIAIACKNSKLIEITSETGLNLNVEKVETERGILIINDKYFLSNEVRIIKGINTLEVNDESIWRLEKGKPIPQVLNIPAPYKAFKKQNNDSIFIFSNRDTIIAKL